GALYRTSASCSKIASTTSPPGAAGSSSSSSSAASGVVSSSQAMPSIPVSTLTHQIASSPCAAAISWSAIRWPSTSLTAGGSHAAASPRRARPSSSSASASLGSVTPASPSATHMARCADASSGCELRTITMPRASSLCRGSRPTISTEFSLPHIAGKRSRSALDDVHGEPTACSLFVLAAHVGPGPPHRLDHLVERDLVRTVPLKGEARGVDRLHRAHRVALDARHLHEAADRIAGQPEVVLHADLGGILDLGRCTAHHLGERAC